MRFYTKSHNHYCGIDLHPKTMYLCILDRNGQTLLHKNVKSRPDDILAAVEPFRDDLVVGVECMFTWYWLAELCRSEDIEFVLGHALYMKAIHGGKAKNDKIDAFKIATLQPGGSIPKAYAYPSEMRVTRDLFRRRQHLVRRRGSLLAHIQNTHHQYNPPTPKAKITYKANREGVSKAFCELDARKSMEMDFARVEQYDAIIKDVENHLVRRAREHDSQAYHLRPRYWEDPGAHDLLRDPRHPSLPESAGLPLLLPTGEVRPHIGRQEARYRRREDRERAPQVGILRGRRPLLALQPGGAEAASPPRR